MENLHAGSATNGLLALYPADGRNCDKDAYVININDPKTWGDIYCEDVELIDNNDGTALIKSAGYEMTVRCWKIPNGTSSAMTHMARIRDECL